MSHDQAVAIIVEGRDRHFDPEVADAFLALQEPFQETAQRFLDSDDELMAAARRMGAR